jgi:hypothetical protein
MLIELSFLCKIYAHPLQYIRIKNVINHIFINFMESDDKGKVIPVHTMNAYGGVEVASLILNIGARWGEWSASHLSCFTPTLCVEQEAGWALGSV